MGRRDGVFLGLWILVIGALILGGVGAVQAFQASWAHRARLSAWVPPTEWDLEGRVEPGVALRVLAGESEDRVFQAAMAAGDLKTAWSLLSSATVLPAGQQAGHWVLLGRYLAREGDWASAREAYETAGVVAVLDPTIAPTTRVEVLLDMARGLVEVRADAAALFYLEQAYGWACGSPWISQAQRRAWLPAFEALFTALGRGSEAWEALSASLTEAEDLPSGSAVTWRVLAVSPPSAVREAEQERQKAIQEMLVVLGPGVYEVPAYMQAQVADALVREDQAREAWFGQVGGVDRIAGLIAQVAWLVKKDWIAAGGTGLSLVPAWEEDRQSIRQALTAAQEALYQALQEEPSTADGASRYLLEAAFLGRVPEVSLAQWCERLDAEGVVDGALHLRVWREKDACRPRWVVEE